MYNYSYDETTGGILLNTSPMQFSKEPRPVYYKELDLLGFDKYWTYVKQDDLPYMWAEANKYYYFGRLVAQTKGGNLYTAPEIDIKEDIKNRLQVIDIKKMLEDNAGYLQVLEQETVKKIYDVWKRHKGKLDVFHVAFSGGKDSIVLLDLVKKALPKDEFVVVFGDTQMEFSDTYDVIDKVEEQCKTEGIKFFRAKSHMDVYDSWKQFAPPSRVLRWCCHVHKTTPQTKKLREILENQNYEGMDFIGVRASESANRSEYDFESFGTKQKGQYSSRPILEWTSYEIWLYTYLNNLIVNDAYKKGLARVGCLLCPMGGGRSDYMRISNYEDDVNCFASIIMDFNDRETISNDKYLTEGGWNSRKSGINIKNLGLNYQEKQNAEYLEIALECPRTNWKEWIKTLGEVNIYEDSCVINTKSETVEFSHEVKDNKLNFKLPIKYIKLSPTFGKLFRYVFRKAQHCVGCGTCEINCTFGCISFDANKVKINDCVHCNNCYDLPAGCLVYDSLKLPNRSGSVMKSVNTFATHLPKTDWLMDFFERQEGFLVESNLGVKQIQYFKKFLQEAELIDKNGITKLTERITQLGWDSITSLGIIIANIAYNPQFEWYIKNMDIGRFYKRNDLNDMFKVQGVPDRNAKDIIYSYGRFVQTPFGMTLNFGYVDSEENYTRNKCHIGSPLVILYSLYKFAEACGDYYEFTIRRLFNFHIESTGISPVQIFGVEEEELKTMLRGLSASHSDYISVKFTHDLDTISLNRNKTANDIIELL